MTAEKPAELPPSPQQSEHAIPAAQEATELEAKSDRYHSIMRTTATVGAIAAGYAAAGEFVSEVIGDIYTNAPLAELSYWGAGTIGAISLAAALGARFSRDGHWRDACELRMTLDEDRS